MPLEQSFIEFVYHNGTPVTSENLVVQSYSDISFKRDNLAEFEALAAEGKKKVQPVHSDAQAVALAEYLGRLRRSSAGIKERKNNDRIPWQKVIDQQREASEPWEKCFKDLDTEGKGYIASWQAQKIAGRLTAKERDEQKAEAKRAEATYSDNPRKARQAALAAKAYEKEAKEMAKTPVLPGIDTEEFLQEVRVIDRRKASAMDEEAVGVTPFHQWFVKDIAQKKKAGVKIWAHMYPGIELVFGTRVKLPRP